MLEVTKVQAQRRKPGILKSKKLRRLLTVFFLNMSFGMAGGLVGGTGSGGSGKSKNDSLSKADEISDEEYARVQANINAMQEKEKKKSKSKEQVDNSIEFDEYHTPGGGFPT